MQSSRPGCSEPMVGDEYIAFASSSRDCRVPRDIFQLSESLESIGSDPYVSRAVRRKALRKQHACNELHRTIRSVNSLYSGCVKAGPPPPHLKDSRVSAMSLAQSEVFSHLRETVKTLAPPPPELSPTGAVHQLRGASGYSDTCQSSSLGSYDPSLVALPDGSLRPVPIDEVFAPSDLDAGRNFSHGFINSALLPSDEAIARLCSCGVHKVHSDPLLRKPKIYGDFVIRLLSAGLVDVSTDYDF